MNQTGSSVKEVSGVMLFRKDGAILMQHRDEKPGIPYAGWWSIPSGRKEANESWEECARREILEETGYHSATLRHLARVTGREDTGTDYELNVFWECYDGNQKLQCLEGQGIEFIERGRASSYQMLPFLLEVWDKGLKEIK